MDKPWMCAALVGVLGSMVAIGARPAEACSPPIALGIDLWGGDDSITDVPTDGVLAFRITAYGPVDEALALLSVDVTLGDVAIAGAFETVEIPGSAPDGYEQRDLIVVWRPDAGWTPSSSYAVMIAVQDPADPEAPEPVGTFELTFASSDVTAGPLPVSTLSEAALAADGVPEGRRVCCDEDVGACVIDCAAVDLVDHPSLSATLSVAADPMLSQSYLRFVSGTPTALEVYATYGIASELSGSPMLGFDFADVADEYCLGVEVVSLIDQSVGEPVVVCREHGDLVLGTVPNPAVDLVAQGCEMPFWEDDGSPYEGGGGGSDGGDDSGGSDGGSDSAGDSAGGDPGQGDDASADGCACGVGGDRGAWGAVGLLVMLALGRGRRTGIARQRRRA
jgi:hypothetical protein